MEMWDVLDSNRKFTGKVIERGKPMEKHEYHVVVDVWMKNSNDQYLISKRTANKTFPNIWETTGGSAVSGDTSYDAAIREVKEEIGLDLSSSKGKNIFTQKRSFKEFPDFLDIWLFETEVSIDKLTFQPDEVCDAKWASKDEIISMTEKGMFFKFEYLDALFNYELIIEN